MEILIGFIVVTAVGLLAGIILALASHFMHVPVDETVAKVRENLPGVNCGACGFTGCDEYAKAVAEKRAKTNLCVPGADAVSEKISKIMGVEFEDVVEMIAFVSCNGDCASSNKKAEFGGTKTCKAASMLYAGPNSCPNGCLGCGDCANVCPNNAICVRDGIAHIRAEMCVGCGLCVKTCPKGIIKLIPQISKTVVICSNTEKGAVARKECKNACIGCKKCEMNCPAGAIKVENNLARVNYDLCTGCGLCFENCPVKCIRRIWKDNEIPKPVSE